VKKKCWAEMYIRLQDVGRAREGRGLGGREGLRRGEATRWYSGWLLKEDIGGNYPRLFVTV